MASLKIEDSIVAGVDLRKSKKLIRHLRSLDLQRADFEYLKQRLSPLLNGYFIGSTTANIGEPIYRAVPWREKPTRKADLSYPRPEMVSLGRANTQGNPMFYGSAGCHSTIMELEPRPGDRLAISKWRTTANLHLVCAGYTASALKGKAGLNRYEELPWVARYTSDPLSGRRGNGVVHEFVAREFTKKVLGTERWNYKISAAISELILNARSFGIGSAPAVELAGILYPSTPNEANADNVALRCSTADGCLDFVWTQYIEITEKKVGPTGPTGPTYSMRGLDYSDHISESGEIRWQDAFPSERIAGTDHVVRYIEDKIEIVDNKNHVVACIPYRSDEFLDGALVVQDSIF